MRRARRAAWLGLPAPVHLGPACTAAASAGRRRRLLLRVALPGTKDARPPTASPRVRPPPAPPPPPAAATPRSLPASPPTFFPSLLQLAGKDEMAPLQAGQLYTLPSMQFLESMLSDFDRQARPGGWCRAPAMPAARLLLARLQRSFVCWPWCAAAACA